MPFSFAHKIIIIPKKTETLENWSLQRSESCLAPGAQLHTFCVLFLSVCGCPVSVLIIRCSQGVAKTSINSGMDLAHRSAVAIVLVPRQCLDVYFEVCPRVAS